jgi:DNA-binding response OmpR family regulator
MAVNFVRRGLVAKVLLVEDNADLASQLSSWLRNENYYVDVCADGSSALENLKFYKYDIVILDWELPGQIKGVDVCRQFRSDGGQTPVIMLTGRSKLDDKERGLDAGSDDYLTKPFEPRELAARMRSLLRRPTTYTGTVLTVGTISLETDTAVVRKNGTEIQLLPLEYKLLEFLMRHQGQPFSPESLLDRVWGSDSDASIDAVRTCVKTLRRKIAGQDGSSILRTVHGVGYKLAP